MSENLKFGDRVEIIYYEEGISDAPSECIGKVGKVVGVSTTYGTHTHNVEFEEEILGDYFWFFTPEQLKLV